MWTQPYIKPGPSPKGEEERKRRFWLHVDKTPGLGPKGDCWEWRGKKGNFGYGRHFYVDELGLRWVTGPHRVSYYYTHGFISLAHDVLHKCDNRLCVNPDHLFLGDDFDNQRDRFSKGRGNLPTGEQHWHVHVDVATTERIGRAFINADKHTSGRLKSGELTRLSKQFNVSPADIRGAIIRYLKRHQVTR